jgi:hypothetical protein
MMIFTSKTQTHWKKREKTPLKLNTKEYALNSRIYLRFFERYVFIRPPIWRVRDD